MNKNKMAVLDKFSLQSNKFIYKGKFIRLYNKIYDDIKISPFATFESTVKQKLYKKRLLQSF